MECPTANHSDQKLEILRVFAIGCGSYVSKLPEPCRYVDMLARALCRGLVDGVDADMAPTFKVELVQSWATWAISEIDLNQNLTKWALSITNTARLAPT